VDPDTEDAALAQMELEARRWNEDQLLKRLRKDCSGFREECDEFSAEFQSAVKAALTGERRAQGK
jgi:hypothetical protein